MRVIAALLGALLALTSMSVRADELQVTVASGALSGFASRDGLVRSFKGVPYAAPPVGALRVCQEITDSTFDRVRLGFTIVF